jgi:hypothetical protein
MIFTHHMGEDVILSSLAAGGTTAATGLLLVTRAKLDSVVRWLRRK